MTSFVLVHGGAHAAWCWERLMPHLSSEPHVEHVLAVDLCGHGGRVDAKPQDGISIADYVDDVVREVEANDLHDVVLVGHSLAGLTISHAAVRLRGRIRRVIHLSTSRRRSGCCRASVVLERDEALVPDFQRIQAATAEADEIVTFDAGHSAFASRPRELAELLLRYA